MALKVPEFNIQVPSLGIPYQDDNITTDKEIRKGIFMCRAIKASDNLIWTTQKYINDGSAMRRFLAKLIKSDIDVGQLLQSDITVLLFQLRMMSSKKGKDYKFEVICSNCSKKIEDLEVDISEIEVKTFEDDNRTYPIRIDLEDAEKYKVIVDYPRLWHDEQVEKWTRTKRKAEVNMELIYRKMAATIKIIEPDGTEIDEGDWRDFYMDLTMDDSKLITDAMTFDSGINKINNIVCNECGVTDDYRVPIGKNFFQF